MSNVRVLITAMLAGCFASAVPLQAADFPYEGAILRNNTKYRITYQYQHTEKGAWKTLTLDPGKKHTFSFRKRPGLDTRIFIRFDKTIGDGRTVLQTEMLWNGTTSKPNDGRVQYFSVDKTTLILARY